MSIEFIFGIIVFLTSYNMLYDILIRNIIHDRIFFRHDRINRKKNK